MIKVYKGSIQIAGTLDELSQDLTDAIGGVKKAFRNNGESEALIEMVVNDAVRMADMTEAERVDAMIEDIDKLISEWLSPLGKMTRKNGGNTND